MHVRLTAAGFTLAFSGLTGCALVYSFSDYTMGAGGAGGSVGSGGAGTASSSSSSSGASSSSSAASTGSSTASSTSSGGCTMAPADPIDGDCKKPVCTNGMLEMVIDDTDVAPFMP